MAKLHQLLAPFAVNQAAFVSNTNPATDPDNLVSKRKIWIQTDSDVTPTAVLDVWIRNEANDAWIKVTRGFGSFDPANYAPLASPAFTGNPTAPTPAANDNDTSIATTAYVQGELTDLLNGVSSSFDTLAEIATELGLKAPLASPALTGNPTAPTPAANDNDTSIATTAYVQTELADYAPLASPALTGNPTAPTPSEGDSDTSIATTAFVANAVAGGGGGVAGLPSWLAALRDAPPASPDAANDEFIGGSLDGKWTETLTGSPVIKYNDPVAPSCYAAHVNAATEASRLSQAFAPAGDFSVSCKVMVAWTVSGNTPRFELRLIDSGDTAGIIARTDWSGPGNVPRVIATNRTTSVDAAFGSTFNLPQTGTTLAIPACPVYLHIQRVGTTWTVMWSPNGCAWIIVGTATKTVTIAKLQLFMDENNDSAAHQMAVDWVRANLFFNAP